MALSFLGLYLIVSDPRKLLQKTPYGQALTRLGDPVALMAEIDREALRQCEQHGSFTLLNRWLVLYQPNGWYYEPKRQCAIPLPRERIGAVHALPPDNPYDPQEFRVCLVCGSEQYVFRCYQKQDLNALISWIGNKEERNP